jgi:hypothetical protein
MKRVPVTSTSLASVGYLADTNTLEVEFRHGSCYRYFAVPKHTYHALLAAPSKGAFLNTHIKNRYPFERAST